MVLPTYVAAAGTAHRRVGSECSSGPQSSLRSLLICPLVRALMQLIELAFAIDRIAIAILLRAG